MQFTIFSRAKAVATDNGRNTSLSRIAGAGAFTGVFVALVEGPQDLFKSQLQAQMAGGAGGGRARAHPRPPPRG